jgi:hypothetical protein
MPVAPRKTHASIIAAILMKRIDSHPFLFASLQGEEITSMFKYLPSQEGKITAMIL